MKLTNKFLTALAPVAMVGVTTPTLVACNKGSNYSIHYGDDVNCLKKELGHYHSRNDVKSAIKSRIDQEPKRDDINIDQINADLATKSYVQFLYYELIASPVFSGKNVSVLNWKASDNKTYVTFNYNGSSESTSVSILTSAACFQYIEYDDSREIYIYVNSSPAIPPFKSYRFWNCKTAAS